MEVKLLESTLASVAVLGLKVEFATEIPLSICSGRGSTALYVITYLVGLLM